MKSSIVEPDGYICQRILFSLFSLKFQFFFNKLINNLKYKIIFFYFFIYLIIILHVIISSHNKFFTFAGIEANLLF
jgi:hypothetical protein